MKNFKLMFPILLICVFSLLFFAQSTNVYLTKEHSNVPGKTFINRSGELVIMDDTGMIGFKINPDITNNLNFGKINVAIFGMGTRYQNDKITIRFENGKIIEKISPNEYNKSGIAYFNIDANDIILLETIPVTSIKICNGITNNSYMGNVSEKDKKYFIELLNSSNNKLISKK